MKGRYGTFVTVEGIEGAGKSTLVEGIATWLRSEGIHAVTTRDPGGTVIGEKIRRLLLAPAEPETHVVTATAEAMLYAAARAQLVSEIIEPALVGGQFVMCDRFVDSFVAYQSYGRGLPKSLIVSLNEAATHGLLPDRTLVVDVDPHTSLGRVTQPDRLEREDLGFHVRVREGFLDIARMDPERISVLDGSLPPDELLLAARVALASLVGNEKSDA